MALVVALRQQPLELVDVRGLALRFIVLRDAALDDPGISLLGGCTDGRSVLLVSNDRSWNVLSRTSPRCPPCPP